MCGDKRESKDKIRVKMGVNSMKGQNAKIPSRRCSCRNAHPLTAHSSDINASLKIYQR